ncbi:MAG: SurA N-terminal domain-containing protein [Myxococcota bacterium]
MFCRFALFSITLLSCLHAEVIDRVVAIVKGEPILQSDLKKNQTLDDLIDAELIEQEAKKLGLLPSESELSQASENVRKQNRLTPLAFEEALKSQGMTIASYRAQMRQQIIKSRIIQNKIKSRITPTTQTSFQVEAEQAIFASKKDAEAAIRAKKIDFKSIGTVSKDDLLPDIAKVVFSLKEGETSRPLESPQGFRVFKVTKRVEIPLEKVDKQRYEQEIENAYKRYVTELRASAYIERK